MQIVSVNGRKLVVPVLRAWLVAFQAQKSGLAGAEVGYREGSTGIMPDAASNVQQ